ncbi:MAG: NAD(P)-dependent oxidoreductase [Alphaproteobacteria bacterium]|nr:NAD(P)-dependent oxidoreductase [Alphaproteobacteria bacterium]
MSDRPTLLVTGAAGCIGAWVIAKLCASGRPVVAFDRSDDRRRLHLVMSEAAATAVPWARGDIADAEAVAAAVAEHRVGGVIHLAALQIPFCKADPIGGAKVNVVGQVAVFEAARRHGLERVVYASSVAALPADPREAHPATLYGVYKWADEGIARVYWQEANIPSIGIRPHSVYGPGRDQGLTSAPTKAMVAAVLGQGYTIPFTGPLAFQYVGEVAEAFIAAAGCDPAGAFVHDLKGEVTTVEGVVAAIRRAVPGATIAAEGPHLPLPGDFDDSALRRLVGPWPQTTLDDGVARSVSAFRDLVARGLVTSAA